jgi:antitoxin component YwqK of YwqJK toxin-antitoxin module
MKKHIMISLLALLLAGCGSTVVDVVVEKFPDGKQKIVRKYSIDGKDSVLLKETVFYITQQKYMEGKFVNGKRDSVWTAWLENGQIWTQGSYKNGLEDGIKIVYHENGMKFYEGRFKMGKRVGVWTFYGNDGVIAKRVDYDAKPPKEL